MASMTEVTRQLYEGIKENNSRKVEWAVSAAKASDINFKPESSLWSAFQGTPLFEAIVWGRESDPADEKSLRENRKIIKLLLSHPNIDLEVASSDEKKDWKTFGKPQKTPLVSILALGDVKFHDATLIFIESLVEKPEGAHRDRADISVRNILKGKDLSEDQKDAFQKKLLDYGYRGGAALEGPLLLKYRQLDALAKELHGDSWNALSPLEKGREALLVHIDILANTRYLESHNYTGRAFHTAFWEENSVERRMYLLSVNYYKTLSKEVRKENRDLHLAAMKAFGQSPFSYAERGAEDVHQNLLIHKSIARNRGLDSGAYSQLEAEELKQNREGFLKEMKLEIARSLGVTLKTYSSLLPAKQRSREYAFLTQKSVVLNKHRVNQAVKALMPIVPTQTPLEVSNKASRNSKVTSSKVSEQSLKESHPQLQAHPSPLSAERAREMNEIQEGMPIKTQEMAEIKKGEFLRLLEKAKEAPVPAAVQKPLLKRSASPKISGPQKSSPQRSTRPLLPILEMPSLAKLALDPLNSTKAPGLKETIKEQSSRMKSSSPGRSSPRREQPEQQWERA